MNRERTHSLRQPLARALILALLVALVVGLAPGRFNAGALAAPSAQEQAPEAPAVETHLYLPAVSSQFPFVSLFGVEMSNITPAGGLNAMDQAGAHYVRRNALKWSDVEASNTTPENYNWGAVSKLDEEIANAASRGMEVILVIRSTPSWAQAISGSYCGPIQEQYFNEFGQFLYEAVKRYSDPRFSVKYYEIWNEPDVAAGLVDPNELFGCWGSSDPNDLYYGGLYYGQMLQAVDDSIRSANPEAQILVGGLLLDCDPDLPGACADIRAPRFLEGVLRSGAAPAFDGVSFHAYDYYCPADLPECMTTSSLGKYGNANWNSSWNTTGPVVFAKTQFLHDVLQQYGADDKYLMNTESALLILGDTCDDDCQTTKAYYLIHNYAAAIELNLKANIWFTALGWQGSGLLNNNLSPLPAYEAYKFAFTQMAKAENFTRTSDPSVGDAVRIYTFQKGGQQVWLVWSMDGVAHNLSLPSAPAHIFNAFGIEQPVSGADFSVGLEPHYLVWNP